MSSWKVLKMEPRQPMDGGYGWVVVAASFMAHALEFSVMLSGGVFYVIFLEQIEDQKSAVALVASLSTACCYLIGPLAGLLMNRFGARRILMIGGMIGSFGTIFSTWATNIYHLYATFGILSGIGFGLAYIPTISIVGLYFNRRRPLALGIACSGFAFASVVFPPISLYLVEEYGWRGSLLLLGALSLNTCVCGALMRPPPMLRPPSESDEKKEITPAKKLSGLNVFIFKNIDYLCFCVSYILYSFGTSIVTIHLAAYSGSHGYSESKGALLLSIFGITHFVGRICFGLFSQLPCANTTFLYMFGLASSGITCLILPSMASYPGFVTFAASFGFLSGSYGTLSPQAIINILGVGLLASGYGYSLVFCGSGYMAGAPVAGWLYERTNLYEASFYLAGACQVTAGLLMVKPWLLPRKPRIAESTNSEDVVTKEERLTDHL